MTKSISKSKHQQKAGCMLISVLLFISTASFAQQSTVQWGPEAKIKSSRWSDVQYIGEDKDALFYWHSKGKKTSIEEFSKDLRFRREHPLDNGTTNSVYYTVHKGYFNSYLIDRDVKHSFASLMIGADTKDNVSIVAQKMDFMGSVMKKTTVAEFERIEDYELKKSHNDSLVSVMAYRKNNDDKHAMDIYLTSYNTNEEEINSSLIHTVDFNKADIGVGDFVIDRSGRAAVLVSALADKRARKKYHLLVFDRTGKLENDQILEFKTYDVDEPALRLTKKGDILVAGTYFTQEGKKDNTIEGIFLAKYNRDKNSIVNVSYSAVTPELLKKYEMDKKGKVDFNGWLEMDFYLDEEGENGHLLADHRRKYTVTTTSSSGMTNTTTHYMHKEILVISVEDGILSNTIVLVPRLQHSTSTTPNGFGYYALKKENNLHIIFNDHFENSVLNDMVDINELRSPISGNTLMFTIGEDQIKEKTKLAVNPKVGGFFDPNKTFVKDDVIYLGMRNKKSGRIGTLKL